MTREQIENEAYSRLDTSENEWDAIFNSGYSRGFMSGAQWRINSVWHKNSVRPGEDCDVLVETKCGIELDRYDIDYNELDNGTDWETEVIRWAYIDDILPERKEEAE